MSIFEAKSLCILGRLPAISTAELEALYGAGHIRPIGPGALLDIDVENIEFRRLGGTLKLARVLNILDYAKWPQLEKYLIENIPPHLQYVPEGTFRLGISAYGFDVSAAVINQTLMKVKKVIRSTGRSMRVVPNKAPELNSAQVLHNRLTTKGGWELLLIRDGPKTILAQTIFVQDIEAYAARDQARPKRDARVGMLPPKLAQTIINLAQPKAGATILDPFCGTGVILQEALLMGFKVVGSDAEPRMVKASEANLEWLKNQKPNLDFNVELKVADATTARWEPDVGAVASEIYLGDPLFKLPQPPQLAEIVEKVDNLLVRFLKNIAPQLKPGTGLCLAVPAWQIAPGKFKHLPAIAKLTDMGYTYLDFVHVSPSELIYSRPSQIVARELLVLKKK